MNRMQAQVEEFHRRVVGEPVSPAEPKIRGGELRARLILEEAREAAVGLVGGRQAMILVGEQWRRAAEEDFAKPVDVVAAVDGCVDSLYVAFGTLSAIGVDAEPFFDDVHRANMEKVSGATRDGVPGKKGEKPPGWRPPRTRELLDERRREFSARQFSTRVVREFDDLLRAFNVAPSPCADPSCLICCQLTVRG